eukprot:m.13687 g.13687  ORF g.13687 m.13687 type:complete len:51 (-) comp10204_c1_seq1:20-172(-)
MIATRTVTLAETVFLFPSHTPGQPQLSPSIPSINLVFSFYQLSHLTSGLF